MSKARAEAFSDGVFAVAITVLIFNVTDSIHKQGPGDLLPALLGGWPAYAAYVASFLTIGVISLGIAWLFGVGMGALERRLALPGSR